MKGDDIIKSEDLLSNKEELNRMISEGDAKPAREEKAEETAVNAETEAKREVIKVHSDNPNMKWYIVYDRTGDKSKGTA
jgi:hypothetical protein